jgi:ferredoxin-nitrite reductase
MTGDFEPEQKRYLEGFVAGLQIAKAAGGFPRPATGTAPANTAPATAASGPDAPHIAAQDRVVKAGGVRPGEIQARAASLRRL